MPALSNAAPCHRPALQHVNMQIDCFLANSPADDLRAIVRTLLATGPAGTSGAFVKIARSRVQRNASKYQLCPSSSYFANPSDPQPTQSFWDALSRARTVFGIGLGFQSIPFLTTLITATLPLHWEIDSEMEDTLAILDCDISQAIQSCKEQLANDLVDDIDGARLTLCALRTALVHSRTECDAWGGEFPFERAVMAVDGWKW